MTLQLRRSIEESLFIKKNIGTDHDGGEHTELFADDRCFDRDSRLEPWQTGPTRSSHHALTAFCPGGLLSQVHVT